MVTPAARRPRPPTGVPVAVRGTAGRRTLADRLLRLQLRPQRLLRAPAPDLPAGQHPGQRDGPDALSGGSGTTTVVAAPPATAGAVCRRGCRRIRSSRRAAGEPGSRLQVDPAGPQQRPCGGGGDGERPDVRLLLRVGPGRRAARAQPVPGTEPHGVVRRPLRRDEAAADVPGDGPGGRTGDRHPVVLPVGNQVPVLHMVAGHGPTAAARRLSPAPRAASRGGWGRPTPGPPATGAAGTGRAAPGGRRGTR